MRFVVPDLLDDQGCFETVVATSLLPFRIIAVACFGELVLQENNYTRLWSLVELHERILQTAALSRVTRWSFYELLFWTKPNREMTEFQTAFTAFCLDMVNQAREDSSMESSPASTQYCQVEAGCITLAEWIQSEYTRHRQAVTRLTEFCLVYSN